MGGKAKQAQRTKNNSRPSSSGRSAELLGSTVPGFVGFTTVENFGFVPGFSAVTDNNLPDEFDSNVDPTFQLVLRKMTKKDPTTKVKALQEFIELVTKAEMESVKAILPFWPRLYSSLAMDVEHRVRETTQLAQAAVVTKVGKNIAPYLRNLCPAWISSQYDTYAPAASLATNCFQKAFPPHKVKEVFNFCQNEILDFIIKNITVQTQQTLCNPKSYTPEEAESKYQRVIASSLKGYALYLNKLDESQIKESIIKNELLVDHPKFWSFHKHKSNNIRSAWFEVIVSLMENGLGLLDKHEAQLCLCVLSNLDEIDPTVLPHVWAAILLVQAKFDEWYTHINIEKALLPKLWKTIKTGGNGNARTIFPHMLPLISKFTKNVLNEKLMKFYLDFFENFTEGLKTKSIQISRTDVCSVSTAYYECLQYIIIQLQTNGVLSNDDEIEEICLKLIDEHLLEIIKWCLTTEVSYEKHIFYQISPLLNYWSQNFRETKLYDILLKRFWLKLHDLIIFSLETNEDSEQVTETQIELIKSLKSSMSNQFKKKHIKVKFNTEIDTEDTDEIDSCITNTNEITLGYETELNDLVYKLCDIYIEYASKKKDSVFIEKFETLLKCFDKYELFKKLAKSDDLKILCSKFIDWLSYDELRLEIVIDILLEIYKFLTVDEKIELLKKLIQYPNEIVQNWIIIRILSHPLCNELHVPIILAEQQVTEHLIKCANRVINGDTNDNLNLLHKCFFQTDSGDILINAETCEMIVDVISKPFNECNIDEVLDICGSFFAQIMPVIFTDIGKLKLQHKMFLILFEFSINKMISDDLSEDTLWEITSSWQDALSSNDLKLNDNLLKECSNIVEKKLNSTTETISIKTLENIAEITAKLILCSTERITDDNEKLVMVDKIIDSILNEKTKEYKSNKQYLEHFCLYVQSLNGRLAITSITDEKLFDESQYNNVLINYMKASIFKLNVIFKLTCNDKKQSMEINNIVIENQDDEKTEDYCDLDESLIKIWSDEIYEQIFDVFYCNSLSDILLFNSNDIATLSETLMLYIGERLNLFLTSISSEILIHIREKLFKIVNKNGLLWTNCLLPFLKLEQYCDKDNGGILLYEDVVAVVTKEENVNTYINILQILTPTISSNCLPIVTNLNLDSNNLTVKLISLRCLIKNHFNSNFNEINDHKVIENSLNILTEISGKSREDINYLLYNKDIIDDSFEKITFVAETINFLSEAINYFPTELNITQWDFVRIALSSWTLSVSKSLHNYRLPKVSIFIVAVYKLFVSLMKFINLESTKSSTGNLIKVIEEWEYVFAKDVNLVLLKSYMTIVNSQGDLNKIQFFLDTTSPTINSLELKYVINGNKIDLKTTLNDLIQFCLTHLSHKCHNVRIASVNIIKKLAKNLIANDLLILNKRNDEQVDDKSLISDWHILQQFSSAIEEHHKLLEKYIEDFNFRINEINELEIIPKIETIPYLLLWECIIDICAKSSSEIRSIYATWITGHKYEQIMLPLLFRIMPSDVLKNPDTKVVFGQTMFTRLEWKQITNPNISPERYSCHIFGEMLRYLPAVARKWWHDLPQRPSSLVEKITTNCISPQISQEELRSLIDKKEKYENMQIKVHTSAREVIATYSIDETRMELILNLPPNHPLGSVKIESGRQIGGRLQSRVLVMQLTIFLTHQNGSIWEGLSLWKRNLDRKFEGVEECYVCYSVIHQDTCLLPKLSCKTCRKKFHGPCLYKWFSTSNKSTCPICRNIF